ncbi:hypothetical protein GE061_016560 [Apolygus lucorum]|uniref:SUEL-type lectin domain-containing protein n=1 Tax=Apolygus lucorum TaxID=248454 RepID=A0A6A4JWR8_APOLU|nr:hypothetical protein GE061_016560 [Apolygus lucorum]
MPLVFLSVSTNAMNIIVKRTCKHDTLTLRCQEDRHIHVINAYFASNETICRQMGSAVPLKCPEKAPPLQKLIKKCDYKKICSINHGYLDDDLCGNSYLEVEYKCCLTNKIAKKYAYLCKHQHSLQLKMSCKENAIKIMDAGFGRGSVCPPPNRNPQILLNSKKQNLADLVSKKLGDKCDGSRNCSASWSDIFKLPSEKSGYLEVRYNCDHDEK